MTTTIPNGRVNIASFHYNENYKLYCSLNTFIHPFIYNLHSVMHKCVFL